MRILVLGGGGMLGHKMSQILSRRFPDTWCTLRGSATLAPWRSALAVPPERVIESVDATDFEGFDTVLRRVRPSVVVNCIGAIKQRAEAPDATLAITINALLPHRVAAVAAEWDGRVIHFSTDCVFSGRRGRYREEDEPDATDLYGKTKYLGELVAPNTVTLRTSFIGRELQHRQSLLEWFLAQEHQRVRGYRQVWWSGVTTNHLAGVVADLIERHPGLAGLYHLSSGRISKYELLCKLREGLGLDVAVEPDDSVVSDRSLDGSRFARATGYQSPPWETLIAELAADPTPYDAWAGAHEDSR